MKINKSSLILVAIFFIATQFIVAQTDFNKLDEKGNKHGLWKGNYQESQRPRYEGTFNHGKEVGVFTYFDDTKAKTVIATRTFSEKDNSAYTIFYSQKKFVVSEGNAVNKLNEGEWKYYHKDSKVIMTTENYKNGKLNGMRTVYFPNSKIAEAVNYTNGLKNGNYKNYSETGIVLEDSNYKNDKYEGKAVYRDPLGNIAAEGNFTNGKKTGVWKFYINGKLDYSENMSFQHKNKKASKDKTK